MQFDTVLYIAYSDTSITILIVAALLFWDRRSAAGAKFMALMMCSAALWGFSDFMSDMSGSLVPKLFWNDLSYTGVVIIPAAWIFFVLEYTKQHKYLTRRNFLLLLLIPAVTVILVWTNDFHHLMVSSYSLVKSGELTVLDTYTGPWFWVHAVYSYSLFLTGIIVLIRALVTLPSILWKQTVLILTAILIPLIMSFFYTLGISPLYPVDLTILSFTFTGVLCFYGMFKYKLFELVPAARNMVVESMNGLLVVLDDKNHIIDMNYSARKLFGSMKEDYIGKNIFDLPGKLSEDFRKYENILQAEEKITINTNDGKRHFDFRIVPLYGIRKKMTGKFVTLYDITALEEAIENLKESNKTAEEASKAKTQFLATMSHEIRTPLNGIIGMTELLASAQYTGEEKKYHETLRSCAVSLLDIVNDILDFSKIEAGKMELEKTDFNLRDLVEGAADTFLHQSMESGIKFVLSIDTSLPMALNGDPVRVRQILVNLLSNALKFTSQGKVEIGADLVDQEENRIIVRFLVTDTGIGIPEDKIVSLFEHFQQVDSSTTRRFGGTGLGLAIVRNLVTMMGGTIEVESKYGEGSRFSVTLPFQVSGNAVAEANAASEPDFGEKELSILLAEDNKANQLLIIKLLEKKKMAVDIAFNGKEALSKLKEKTYDLILMDIQMPEMDGYEATRTIRDDEAYSGGHIPIIALTANAAEEDRRLCLEAGMDDYLAKPIRTEKLYECIYRHAR